MRAQMVIEQAKGMLAERLGGGIDDAYAHLLELAAESGTEPAAIAALLLGAEPPAPEDDRPVSGGRRATRDGTGPEYASAVFDPATYLTPLDTGPDAEPGAGADPTRPAIPPDTALAIAAFTEARTPDELARLLTVGALSLVGAHGVLLTAVEPDGALRLVGSHGLPAHVVSEWTRIPPHVNVALVRAVVTGVPLWEPETTAEHTVVGGAAGFTGPRASVPLYADGRVFGALEIIWPDGPDPSAAGGEDGDRGQAGSRIDDSVRRYVTAVVTACGHRLRELLGRTGAPPATADAPWLRAVLDVIPCPAALLSPVRDAAGRVTDFKLDACNSDAMIDAAGNRQELVGKLLLESFPGLALSGLFDAYVQVLESGNPMCSPPREYAAVSSGKVLPSLISIRTHRVGGGLLVSWRFHDNPADNSGDLATQLGQAQRLGNLGWSEWDLATDTARWSDQLYTIFGRDWAEGPVDLDTLSTWVMPEDLPIFKNLMRRLLGQGKPVDAEFRIRRVRPDGTGGGTTDRKGHREEVRHLRVMAEPVIDAFGEPARLRCVFQDVTTRHRAEQSLTASRQQVDRQRRLIENERHNVVELQRAILPLPQGIVHQPGLRAAVRYLPAGSSTRVGGDWYEATSIDDSEVFLAIGDVSGHGRSAVAAMARLRNGLSGLAFTGAAPDELLGWLNRLVLHWPPLLTATALAGRFCPANRTLTWAQAGHLPPVLIHEGKPRLLDPPEGVLLGASPDPEFGMCTTQLAADDLMLLYTDGLIERRKRDIEDGFQLLLSAVESCAAAEPDQVIDHVLDTLGATNPIDDTCLVACRIE
jgi:serine phosphatase RsbU (regulator of sigma subunit)